MKPSRQTQPYRKGINRPPSQVLERMLAGRQTPNPGAGRVLAQGMKKASAGAKRFMPRS